MPRASLRSKVRLSVGDAVKNTLSSVLLASLLGCGGEVDAPTEPACEDSPARTVITVDNVSVGLRSATAVEDRKTGLIAIIASETEDACAEWLAWDGERGRAPLLVAGFNGSDVSSLPASLKIEAHFLPPRSTAVVRLADDCTGRVQGQVGVAGTVSVTAIRVGDRATGTIDAVLERGATLQLPFDTCFCTAAAECQTRL